jgi:hypothetical protein
MTFGTIARRTFFDTVIPPRACDVCLCLCFRGKTIVCKFTFGHIASSNAETELELLRAQVRHLQGQNNVMAMTTTTLTQQLAETSAAVSLEQQKHNRIISNPVFVSALSAMQGPDLDIDTLWWMVQWGNEYLARFKRDGTTARKKAHADYKKWTADTRQKQMAGFLRACALRLVMIPSISPRMIRYSF